MSPELVAALQRLRPTQREAADWGEGAALVLAGPGVGKTTVLTTRIARILDDTRKRNFRILALTFTTKAGDEMRARVEALVPDLAHRTVIGTFHSFCAHVLRQHGSHLGIRPDFGIYDQDQDREELLRDALEQAASRGEPVNPDDTRWLQTIDQLRRSLVSPAKTAQHFRDPSVGDHVARVYTIYENALSQNNIMDFNGMILDTCRLVHQIPAIAARIRQTHRYWHIDEFQDTTPAQYLLVRFLAGDDFKNIFAVADDDQIIYQWAGASYRQIESFQRHFTPALMQIIENRRCPPDIVMAANNLIAHNSDRVPNKRRLVPMLQGDDPSISRCAHKTDTDEAVWIANEIKNAGVSAWGHTVILGRTRAVLEPTLTALRSAGVTASIIARRDQFVSPQFVWLQSCLDLSLRPTDKRTFTTMAGAANRIANMELDAAILAAEASSSGTSYLEHWAVAVKSCENGIGSRLSDYALRLIQSRASWRSIVREAIAWLPTTAIPPPGTTSDADEDKVAWEVATRAIRAEKGGEPELNELLQGLALRPKEPPPDPTSVRLMTIHAAKGLEFEYVWLLGLVEQILPSWQSLAPQAEAAELEEERRNCFVAITRTRRRLVLSYAMQYRSWRRKPSRFLGEMNLDVA